MTSFRSCYGRSASGPSIRKRMANVPDLAHCLSVAAAPRALSAVAACQRQVQRDIAPRFFLVRAVALCAANGYRDQGRGGRRRLHRGDGAALLVGPTLRTGRTRRRTVWRPVPGSEAINDQIGVVAIEKIPSVATALHRRSSTGDSTRRRTRTMASSSSKSQAGSARGTRQSIDSLTQGRTTSCELRQDKFWLARGQAARQYPRSAKALAEARYVRSTSGQASRSPRTCPG